MAKLNIEEIAESHFARIHRAALVLCGNPWDADDLAQETFLALSKQPEGFQGRSSIYTWLYGVLLNLERRERRRYGMRNRKLKVVWENQAETDLAAPPATAAIEAAEWKKAFGRAWRNCPMANGKPWCSGLARDWRTTRSPKCSTVPLARSNRESSMV